MKGKIYNIKQFNGSWLITFLTNENCLHFMDDFAGEDLDIEIGLHRELKSLPQLRLAWKIAELIAHKQRINKREVMLMAMMDYGYSVYLPARDEDMTMLQMVFSHIKDRGMTKLTTPSGKEVECHQLQCWKSVKLYTTEEMAVLIDGLIQMAKDEGIEVQHYEEFMQGR